MVDYSFTQDILKGIGFLYIALTLLALGLAVWLPKRWWGKLMAVALVVGVFSILPRKAQQEVAQQQVKVDEFKQRYQVAKALFDERCKTAGEKIYKTVDNVEGVWLLNVREQRPSTGQYEATSDPNWPDAALPYETAGDFFIINQLGWEQRSPDSAERGYINTIAKGASAKGYDFADVKLDNGTIERYRLAFNAPLSPHLSNLVSEIHKGKPARYAIGFENNINPEDRRHWVAGTTIKVIDTQTNELLAERTSFAFHSGLGSRSGGQQPWLFADTCPKLRGWHERYPTRLFVDQILKPTQEKK